METTSTAVKPISKEDSVTLQTSNFDSGQSESNIQPSLPSASEVVGDDESEKNLSNSPKTENVDDASRAKKDNSSEVSSTLVTASAVSPPASAGTGQEGTFKDEYAEFITYNDNGVAIYTDPTSNHRFEFNNESNQWVPLDASDTGTTGTGSDNPYENEYYRWCHEKNEWILKETPSVPTATGDSNSAIEFKDGVHTYTDKDGVVFFWDNEKNAWFPKIDDDFMAIYQMNYGFVDNTSAPEKKAIAPVTPVATVTGEENKSTGADDGIGGRKRKPEPPKWFEMPAELNTKVYVSNLPLDITQDEFIEVMSKCGMIFRDLQTNKMKVKLYAEPDGQLKGDGLCHYIKVESVQLALNLLDGYDVRGHKLKVQRAQFQLRGEYNPALKPKKSKQQKEKAKKLQQKLFDWRPEKLRGERSKNEKTVIIKNLFTPELFDKEVHLILEYQNDLREECQKCGAVRKVVVYDRHPEGVAQVNMADAEEADLVIQMMNGRFFGQRKLTAETWDGKTKYKIVETEAEANERINKWDEYLTSSEDAKQEAAKASIKSAVDDDDNDDNN